MANFQQETKYLDKFILGSMIERSEGISYDISDRFHLIDKILEKLTFSSKVYFGLNFTVCIFNTNFFNIHEIEKTSYSGSKYFRRSNELDVSFRLSYIEVEKTPIKDLVLLFFDGIRLIKSETEYRKKAPKGFDWDVFWQEFEAYFPYIEQEYLKMYESFKM